MTANLDHAGPIPASTVLGRDGRSVRRRRPLVVPFLVLPLEASRRVRGQLAGQHRWEVAYLTDATAANSTNQLLIERGLS